MEDNQTNEQIIEGYKQRFANIVNIRGSIGDQHHHKRKLCKEILYDEKLSTDEKLQAYEETAKEGGLVNYFKTTLENTKLGFNYHKTRYVFMIIILVLSVILLILWLTNVIGDGLFYGLVISAGCIFLFTLYGLFSNVRNALKKYKECRDDTNAACFIR